MKDKKRVLIILLILIVLITIILGIVLIFGGIRTKKITDYRERLESAACELATKENYTENICKAFPSLCIVHYDKLINSDYIDEDLKNPFNNKKVSEDTKSYIEITWQDNKMICTHKEG